MSSPANQSATVPAAESRRGTGRHPRRPGAALALGLSLAIAVGAVRPQGAAAAGQTGPSGRDVRLAARLLATLETVRASRNSPAMTACVVFPDGTTWAGASGLTDLAAGTPATAETPFGLASVSKTFLAAAIMALVGEGRLHLGDSVARLLPDVPVGGLPIDPRITVRQLLDHTSGLHDHLTEGALGRDALAEPDVAWTPARALAYTDAEREPPGTVYWYSNTGYVLLGLILERLTGRTVAEELRARFFERLGLTSLFVQDAEPPTAPLPVAYRLSGRRADATPSPWVSGTPVRPYRAIVTAAGPAGDIAGNACDAARWIRALATGAAIDPALVTRMVDDARRLVATDLTQPYGLGIQVRVIDGHPSIGHSGRLGHRATVRWFPDLGLGIAVLTNQSRDDPAVALSALLAILAPPRPRPGPVPS